MSRWFVAAWPSATIVERLRALRRYDEPGVRPVPPENWHVTLRFIGDGDERDLASMLASAELPRTIAHLGPRVERLGPRQIVLPAGGVDDLAAAVRNATSPFGQPDTRAFRGHLTIARTRPDAASQLLGTPFEDRFDIDEIALVRSELHPAGAVYTSVARFPTSPAGEADSVDVVTD